MINEHPKRPKGNPLSFTIEFWPSFLPSGKIRMRYSKDLNVEALCAIILSIQGETYKIDIPLTVFDKMIANAQRYLLAGQKEKKGWGDDGMTVRGKIVLMDIDPIPFHFWSPYKDSAYSKFLDEVFGVLRRQHLPEEVSDYFDRLADYYGS